MGLLLKSRRRKGVGGVGARRRKSGKGKKMDRRRGREEWTPLVT